MQPNAMPRGTPAVSALLSHQRCWFFLHQIFSLMGLGANVALWNATLVGGAKVRTWRPAPMVHPPPRWPGRQALSPAFPRPIHLPHCRSWACSSACSCWTTA